MELRNSSVWVTLHHFVCFKHILLPCTSPEAGQAQPGAGLGWWHPPHPLCGCHGDTGWQELGSWLVYPKEVPEGTGWAVLTLGSSSGLSSGNAVLEWLWPHVPKSRVQLWGTAQPWGRQGVSSRFSNLPSAFPARGDSGRLGWAAWGSRALPTAPAKGPAGAITAGAGTGTGHPEGTVLGPPPPGQHPALGVQI